MSDAVLDKLAYAVDADIAPFKARGPELEASAAKMGKAAGDAFSRGMASSSAAAGQGLSTVATASSKAAQEFENLGHHSSYANREIIALAASLSRGNFQAVPFVLGRIGLGFLEISEGALLTGVAIAAIPIAFAAAAVAAESAMAKIRTAMALTGNVSGLTSNSIAQIAQQMSASGLYSGYGAEKEIAALTSAFVPARFQAQAGIAGANYSLSGASSEDVTKTIKEIFADPSKAAQELNDSMHLLSVGQTEQVKDLQESGEYEKASQIVLDAFNARVSEAAQQASIFSKAWAGVTTALGGFITWAGRTTGLAPPPGAEQSELTQLQDRLRALRSGAAMELMPGETASTAARVAELSKSIAEENAAAAAKAQGAIANRAVGDALADANKQSNSFQTHLKELQNELNRDQLAVRLSSDGHKELTATLTKQRDAVKLALQNQISPDREAALRADEERRIAAVHDPAARAQIQGQIEAQREYRRNAQDPRTAPYAQSILQSQMSVAGITRLDRAGEEQTKHLAAMEQEAQTQLDIAKAYQVSGAAADAAKAVGEAHKAVIDKLIADEERYAYALIKRSAAEAAAAAADKLSTQRDAIAGQQRVIAAGGNPALIAHAEAINKAIEETSKETEAAQAQLMLAKTDTQRREALEALTRAQKDYNEALAKNIEQSKNESVIKANATLFGATTSLSNIQARVGLAASGGTSDDLRHLQVLQETWDNLIREGFDPATDEFKRLYQQLLPVNEQVSNLTEAFQKSQAAASSYANAITGPLQSYLTGQTSGSQLLQGIGQQMSSAIIKNVITDPLNEQLKGMFSGILGIGGAPDGSVTNPFFVIPAGLGGITGGGLFGGGGGLFSGGGLFGGSGFFANLLGIVASFGGGAADGADLDPRKFYLVGEKGPEILGPGVPGTITPISAPMVNAPALGSDGGRTARGSDARFGGDTYHMHFSGYADGQSIIRSKSQIASIFTSQAAKGRRNS